MFKKEELKPIDTSKYKITETGQVLKMTKEEFEKEAEEYCMHQSLLEDVRDNICKAFEDGAEFVYNKCNVKLTKAKRIIQDLIDSLEVIDGEQIRELKIVKEAEQFLNSKEVQ